MDTNQIRDELLWRREKIQRFAAEVSAQPALAKLIEEVDSALSRLDNGTYGICVVCKDPIEPERLQADPVTSVCLDHLNEKQQRELENDISLARSIQRSMLPPNDQQMNGWEIYYHYEPLGLVSGDYCDIVRPIESGNSIYIILGDVSGKGIAASMLMTHMQAIFRSLIPLEMPVNHLVNRASRVLCESTSTSHYATLLCAKADNDGIIELCNAGHCLPLLISGGKVTQIQSTGVPIGIFCDNVYGTLNLKLNPGEMLLFYTDGLSEAFSGDSMFDISRIINFAEQNSSLPPKQFTEKLIENLSGFLNGSAKSDDLTIMAIKKV